MEFSVIIPVHNEEKCISLVLDSLMDLDYDKDDFEIIVVNNGSIDNTKIILNNYKVRVIEIDKCAPGVARNIGARISKGKYLAFLDADCVPDMCWLKNASKRLHIEDCVTGSEYKVPANAGWIEKAWFSQNIMKKKYATHINAGNLFVLRDLFMKLGGFDENLVTGEDYELCARIKKHLPIVPDESIAVVHLGNPKNIKSFINREIWHGLGAFSSLKHSIIDKVLISTVVFITLNISIILGAFLLIFTGNFYLFLLSIFGLVILPLITVVFRICYGCNTGAAFFLFVLYYFYYLGRSIALLRISLFLTNYNRTK